MMCEDDGPETKSFIEEAAWGPGSLVRTPLVASTTAYPNPFPVGIRDGDCATAGVHLGFVVLLCCVFISPSPPMDPTGRRIIPYHIICAPRQNSPSAHTGGSPELGCPLLVEKVSGDLTDVYSPLPQRHEPSDEFNFGRSEGFPNRP